MDPPAEGCRLCASTWGDWWETIDGRREFFCCELCARQWRCMLEEIRRATGWTEIDGVALAGGRWGRTGLARRGAARFAFRMAFTPQAELRRFEAIALEALPPELEAGPPA
jgi:hypothetical protein